MTPSADRVRRFPKPHGSGRIGSSQDVLKSRAPSQVGSEVSNLTGRVGSGQEGLKSRGSGRVGSGRVGPRGFEISRVGSGS